MRFSLNRGIFLILLAIKKVLIMENFLEHKVEELSNETSGVVTEKPKQTWKEWFGTEDATQ